MTQVVYSITVTVDDGLVAYYTFDGDATDQSGNGNDGTPNGGVTYSIDRFGNASSAASFDGVDDYVELVSSSNQIGINEDISVSMWAYIEDFNRAVILMSNYDGGVFSESGDFYFAWSPHVDSIINIQFGQGVLKGIKYESENPVVITNGFHHFAFSMDKSLNSNKIKVWIDGGEVVMRPLGTTPNGGEGDGGAIFQTTDPLIVGRHFIDQEYYQGLLDDIRIYNRALSASEITNLYQSSGWDVTNINTFSLAEQTGVAVIDTTANTVNIEVAYGTDVTTLIPTFTLSTGAAAKVGTTDQVSGTTANDFSNAVTYVITNSNGTVESWTISVTVDDGLVAYYTFDGDATDQSGNGNDGTQNGGVDFTAMDRFGNANSAASFDGVDDDVEIGISNDFGISGNMSFSSWVKFDFMDDSNSGIILSNYDAGIFENGDLYFLWRSFDGNNLQVNIGQAANVGIEYISDIGYDLADGNYHHLLFTFDQNGGLNEKIDIWLDGELLAISGNQEGNGGLILQNDRPMYLGRWAGNIQAYLYNKGQIDDAKLWNRVLSVSEIADLYTEGGWPLTSSEALITNFDIPNQTGDEVINGTDISVTMPFDTDVTSLVPTIVISAGGSVVPDTGTSQDFTNSVTYTVTAEDGVTQAVYSVTVTVDDGLVAHYTFDGDATDQSGKGNKGTENGGLTYTTDRFGNSNSAANFDGVDDEVDLGNSWISTTTGEMSFSAWISPTDLSSEFHKYIFSSKQYDITINNSVFRSALFSELDGNTWDGPFVDQSWHMVTTTFDGDSLKMYLDDQVHVSINYVFDPINTISGNAKIGSNIERPSITGDLRYFGKIDDIRIYNRAISASEISDLYSYGGWPLNQAGFTVSNITNDISESGTSATFTVVLDSQPSSNVYFEINSSDTSEGETDLPNLLFTSINWDVPQTITVTGQNDNIVDGMQSFDIIVSVYDPDSDDNYDVLADISIPIINVDNDTAIITVGGLNFEEDSPVDGLIHLPINISNPVDTDVSFTLTTEWVSAFGFDFVFKTQDVTIPALSLEEQYLSIAITADDTVEMDETFNVLLSNLSIANIRDVSFQTNPVIVTIINDDAATISFGMVNPVNEADGSIEIKINLDHPVDEDIVFTGRTVAIGSASNTTDYQRINSTSYTIPTGDFEPNAGTVITIIDDNVVEGTETFEFELSALSTSRNVQFSEGTGTMSSTIAIADADASVISIANAEIVEGSGAMTFQISMSNPVDESISILASTISGTALAGLDFTSIANSDVTFPALNAAIRTVTIQISDNAIVEGIETFDLVLSALNPTAGKNVTFASTTTSETATGTITDNDAATFSIDDVSKNEGTGGTTDYVFTVTLTGQVDQSVTVDYITNDVTTNSSDFTPNTGTLTFTGATATETQTVTVSVNADPQAEQDESFEVILSNVGASGKNVTIADDTGIGTIENDDLPSTPSIIDGQVFAVSEGASNNTLLGEVEVNDLTPGNVSWNIILGNSSDLFEINTINELRIKDNTHLDRELQDSYSLTISVSDGINTSDLAVITINVEDVNDNAPVVQTQNFSITEVESNGKVIGTIEVIDQDESPVFSDYAITSGNEDGIFALNSNSGQLTIQNGNLLDFENANFYIINVTVSDGIFVSLAKNITINVTNINESPVFPDKQFDLDENSLIGTSVGFASAMDPDGDALSYSIRDTELDHAFAINSATGEITVADVTPLNFEIFTSIPITVEVTDNDFIVEAQYVINLSNVDDSSILSALSSNPIEYILSTGGFTVGVYVEDEDGIDEVWIDYKKASHSGYQSTLLAGIAGNYTFDMNNNNMDNIGVQYRFRCIDLQGNVNETLPFITYVVVPGDAKKVETSGGAGSTVKSYSIISFPFDEPDVEDLLSELGSYNKKSWRMYRLNSSLGTYQEYKDFNTVNPGEGYWLILKNDTEIDMGGRTVDITDGAFRINLANGFNMIGNPFQGTLDWSATVQHNVDKGNIVLGDLDNANQSTLYAWNTAYVSKSTLNEFEGGFVKTNKPINNFEIPLTAVSNAGGRSAFALPIPKEVYIDQDSWQLDLYFTSPSYDYYLGAIGMHPEASDQNDKFDREILPHFIVYLDAIFDDGFTRSIKKSEDFKSWTFKIPNNLNEQYVSLSWDIPAGSDKTIILIDSNVKKIIDLKEQKSIQIRNNPETDHYLYFGSKDVIYANLDLPFDLLFELYPNPTTDRVNFGVYASQSKTSKIELISIDGRSMYQREIGLSKGINKQALSFEDISLPEGIYFLKLDNQLMTKVVKR